MSIVAILDRRFYKNVEYNWDDRLFRERILHRLNSGSTLLDLGAGAGIVEAMDFRGKAARICGVDLDPRVLENPMLDESKVSDASGIPYPDAFFDVVFADNVVEHLDQPQHVFAEVARILKPGGYFLFKTPNRTHYMPLVARMTPHAFHRFYNRLRGRKGVDTFPTRYRANTPGAVRALARRSGFLVQSIETIERRPEYLRIWWPLYLIGIIYERLVNSSEVLAGFRILLVAELRKDSDQ